MKATISSKLFAALEATVREVEVPVADLLRDLKAFTVTKVAGTDVEQALVYVLNQEEGFTNLSKDFVDATFLMSWPAIKDGTIFVKDEFEIPEFGPVVRHVSISNLYIGGKFDNGQAKELAQAVYTVIQYAWIRSHPRDDMPQITPIWELNLRGFLFRENVVRGGSGSREVAFVLTEEMALINAAAEACKKLDPRLALWTF